MPKTIKRCFDDKLTFKNMLDAHYRAREGKRKKKEIILFEMDLETNIIRIIDEIRNNTYKFGKYREFKVYEPKERIIKSLPYRDRIVHQWYIEEFIKPYFYKRFINDTFACLDNRGTHLAVKRVQKYMRIMKRKYGSYYVLKCDVKKYFYSIDKEILIDILSKKISDKKLLNFSKIILDDGEPLGIPIGNFTSQYFANIYLNELDHYIKEELRVVYYVRYMDDFILLLEDKDTCRLLLNKIKEFLDEKLHLSLNAKSRYFKNIKGINFCGYRIFETHILLRKRFKKKVYKNIRLWKRLAVSKQFNSQKFMLSYNSFKGHASHANSYNFFRKVDTRIHNLKEFEG